MFDRHLNGSHRLNYYAHGPEWAFAIARYDDGALLDVMEVCSRVWNGAGALILAVDSDGLIDAECRRHVDRRFLDNTWLHPSLTSVARDALKAESALSAVEWDRDPRTWSASCAVHPTQLLESAQDGDRRPAINVPSFHSAPLQRMAQVAWGVIDIPRNGVITSPTGWSTLI